MGLLSLGVCNYIYFSITKPEKLLVITLPPGCTCPVQLCGSVSQIITEAPAQKFRPIIGFPATDGPAPPLIQNYESAHELPRPGVVADLNLIRTPMAGFPLGGLNLSTAARAPELQPGQRRLIRSHSRLPSRLCGFPSQLCGPVTFYTS